MYFNDYLKIAKIHIFFICTLVAIGAFCAFLSTAFIKSGYKAQQTIFISIEKSNPTSLESVDMQAITDTVVAYISSTDYQQTVNADNTPASAKKVAAQVVSLTAISDDPIKSQNALEITTTNFNAISQDLIKNAKVELQNVGKPPPPTKNALNNKVLALFGALLGLATAISIISVSRYFKL